MRPSDGRHFARQEQHTRPVGAGAAFFVNDTDPDNNAGAFEADVAITKL